MCLVGKDKMLTWKIEARVEDHIYREDGRYDVPLRKLGICGRAYDELTHRYDVYTLREMVKELRREQVAAIPGIGPARMRRIDAAVLEYELGWAPEPQLVTVVTDPAECEREAVTV